MVELKRAIEKAPAPEILPKPVEARPKEIPVAPAMPVTPPARPAERVPPVLPKVPLASEIKVESKRAIEKPAPVPVSRPAAPEIVSKPAEARPKVAPAAPIQEEKKKAVKESEKPAAVVSPIVAKTREEKKAVAKAAVTPPPVEIPAPVMPKVMPEPKVPITARKSADVEEQPQVWDARKLKPIGIGIAALLAISLSFVAVNALRKPQVKSPEVKSRTTNRPNTMLVEQQPTVAPKQIATTSETTQPQIASAAETVAPTTTNSPTEVAATQNLPTVPGVT